MEIRGIIHCHSTYSYDAKLSLRELREMFVTQGFQFACMTEHTDELATERADAFVAECAALSDDSFRFIPGFEVPYKHAHVLMVGARDFVANYASTIEVLKEWAKGAAFVILAHPVRNNFAVEDDLLEVIDAVEVWNQQYEGKRVPRPRSIRLFETLRRKKNCLVATGGLDLHREEHMETPFITLTVDTSTESAIIEKLKLGVFSVASEHARFLGLLQNASELSRAHQFESLLSTTTIVIGKSVNAILAHFGITLPRSFRQIVRRRL